MKRLIIIVIFYFSTESKGQDLIFSQSFLVPETINSSFTGSTRGTKAGLISRIQWRSSSLKVSSNFAFADRWFEGMNIGIGISLLNQNESSSGYSFNQINLIYAMAFELGDSWFFRPSITAGVGAKSYGFQNLLFEDQITLGNSFFNPITIDPTILKSQRFFIDIGSSFLINNSDSWIGITFRHLNKPNISLTETGNTPLEIYFSIHTKYHLPILNNIETWLAKKSKIYLLAQYIKQGPYNRLDGGLQYVYDDTISLGLTASKNVEKNPFNSNFINSFNIFTGIHWKNYRFGYSYEFNTSQLMNFGGSHEFSISYDFNVNQRELDRYKCVAFF